MTIAFQQEPFPQELFAIQKSLQSITLRWATQKQLDATEAQSLRSRAAEICHTYYQQRMPIYQKICRRMKIEGAADYDTIINQLMIPDDMFKSYPQILLDQRDYQAMDRWVSSISGVTLKSNPLTPQDIDQWLEYCAAQGITLVFSSGTSGHLSFVPRDTATWQAFTQLPFLYIPAMLADRGILPAWKQALVRRLPRWLSAQRYTSVVQKFGLRSIDGFFFNFSGGNQGIQLVGQEMGLLTRVAHYLYAKKMSAAAVRAIVKGPSSLADAKLLDDIMETTVRQKAQNYERMLSQLQLSIKKKHRVMLFGTPALMKEFCEILQQKRLLITLPKGSSVTYGGGWKSFTGERIPEEQLRQLLQDTLGIEPKAISEGYSMTEINGLMPKCPQGHFHIPPFLDTVVYDEALVPLDGEEVSGTLGIIDPFATSYPGFILTGDNVSLSHKPCDCGLPGSHISKVDRTPGKDVKGCGGIMATVNA